VRDLLINAGVPQERMSAKGYGNTMPVADNATSKGRAQNRRVEFVVSFEQVTYETLDIQGNVIATDTIQ
jgi:outer membrane protein OmpA-like peptidoglycan-associated protein